jgi:hypothetical protein
MVGLQYTRQIGNFPLGNDGSTGFVASTPVVHSRTPDELIVKRSIRGFDAGGIIAGEAPPEKTSRVDPI